MNLIIYSPTKVITFEQLLVEYGDNSCDELIYGELREMESTGLHEEVSGNLPGIIYAEILGFNLSELRYQKKEFRNLFNF